MFEGLIAKLALGAAWSKIKTNAAHDWQAIPPKARLWIIGIVVAVVLAIVHQWYAHRELKARYKAGYDQAVADIRAAEAKKVAPLRELKTTGDAKNVAVNEGVKKVHDAQTSHIDSNLADLLGVLDHAQGGVRDNPGGGLLDAAGSTGPGRAEAPTDDRLAQEPTAQGGGAGDVLIAVPAKQLYVRSAQCDRDYVALTAWEDAYGGWYRNYQDWLAATKRVAKPAH